MVAIRVRFRNVTRNPDQGWEADLVVETNARFREVGEHITDNTSIPGPFRFVHRGKIYCHPQRISDLRGLTDNDVVYVLKSPGPRSPPRSPERDTAERNSSNSGVGIGSGRIMDNPFASLIFDNPALLKSILDANPIVRKMRESIPQVDELLSNPQELKAVFSAMDNPKTARELNRVNDQALSRIDTIPMGMEMLKSAYKDLNSYEEEAKATPIVPPPNRIYKNSTEVQTEPFPSTNQPPAPAPRFPLGIGNVIGGRASGAADFRTERKSSAQKRPQPMAAAMSTDRRGAEIEKACTSRPTQVLDSRLFGRNAMGMTSPLQNLFATRSQVRAQDLAQRRAEDDDMYDAPAPAPSNPVVVVDDTEGYEEKITQLIEMGFPDADMNLEALLIANGDLGAAVEIVSDWVRNGRPK